MTTVRRFVRLTGAAQVAEMRTMTFDGAEHLVVPVIALLGNAVVRPMNSTGPEFVPAEELSLAPGGWDGRPVMPDHPANGTGSANEPKTLERHRFGQLFGTRFEGGKLKTEAWLDVARAERLGGDALRVIERCRAGEPVEVSVGCWVALEQVSGVSPSGVPYEYRWAGVTPDHLAMLPEGVEGACSIEMGCGAPRAAKAEGGGTDAAPGSPCSNAAAPQDLRPNARGELQGSISKPPQSLTQRRAVMRAAKQERKPMNNLMHRILSGLGFRQAAEDEGPSDVDLREKLWDVLYAAEPGLQWIEEVKPQASTVIYSTAPERDLLWWHRSYSVADDGSVTLGDDRVQGNMVQRFEPLAAENADTKPTDHPATARAACGCQTKGDGQAAPATNESESTMSEKVKDLVGRLVANAKSPYTEDDKAHLEALGEAKLAALDAAFEATEPEVKEEPEKAKPETKVEEEPDGTERISAEELADLRAAASAHKRAQAAAKTALLAKLKGKQDVYTEAELQAMGVEALEKVAKLAKVDAEPVRDYSGRGMPVTGSDDSVPPPPDIGDAIRAARGIATN